MNKIDESILNLRIILHKRYLEKKGLIISNKILKDILIKNKDDIEASLKTQKYAREKSAWSWFLTLLD